MTEIRSQIEELFASEDLWLEDGTVEDLLLSLDGVGPVRARQARLAARLSPRAQVRSLSREQIAAIKLSLSLS